MFRAKAPSFGGRPKAGNFHEYFEDDNGRKSMSRLLMFLSFLPASWVLIQEADEGMMGWYIGGYVLGYVGGKGAEQLGRGKKAYDTDLDIEQDERDDNRDSRATANRKRR